MTLFRGLFCLFLILASPALASDLPVIRAAVLKIGTVNWELETITANGLDRKHGFVLDVRPYADNGATRIAVEGGVADMAVADWLWVARQRAAGKGYVFVPYSRAVGSLLVPEGSAAKTLADLKGGKIGIAGGPLDKSWLILQAYAKAREGFDLKAETEQVYGAPPLIFKSGLGGDYAGVVNFWHFGAKMKAAGMRELLSVEEAGEALGLGVEAPLLGYYFKETYLAAHPGLARAFHAASREAKALLMDGDAGWDALRPRMNAASDAEFAALRKDWIAGVPPAGGVDVDAADRLLALLAEVGGPALVGPLKTTPPGLFADLD